MPLTKVIANTFGNRVIFLFEKRNKAYRQYDDVSIAEEKVAIVQKTFQSNWLVLLAGKVGV